MSIKSNRRKQELILLNTPPAFRRKRASLRPLKMKMGALLKEIMKK